MEIFRFDGNYKKNNKNEINLQKQFLLNNIKFCMLLLLFIIYKNNIIHIIKLKFKLFEHNSFEIPLKKNYINKLLKDNIYFNITDFKYSFSYKYNLAKIEYNIIFYDKNDNIIFPSELILYNDINILCHFKTNNTNQTIYSLANIFNKSFTCIEFFNLNENII